MLAGGKEMEHWKWSIVDKAEMFSSDFFLLLTLNMLCSSVYSPYGFSKNVYCREFEALLFVTFDIMIIISSISLIITSCSLSNKILVMLKVHMEKIWEIITIQLLIAN